MRVKQQYYVSIPITVYSGLCLYACWIFSAVENDFFYILYISHISDKIFRILLIFNLIDRLQNDSEETIQTIPTIGFNVEVLQYKNIKFQVRLYYCFFYL